MIYHSEISDDALRKKIKQKEILFGGNRNLKIYGMLSCISGKRMKKENRVFFASQEEAVGKDYRPCGHCMKKEYQTWKDGFIHK